MDKTKRNAKRNPLLGLAVGIMALGMTCCFLTQQAFAKTYVIRDGDRVVTYTTFATDPAQVLGKAGLDLGEFDTFTTEALDGAEEITVRRAQTVTVCYHGEEATVTTFGETAGELLCRLNLEPGEDDVISQALDSQTYDGMVLTVDRILTVQETYTVDLAHEVIYCQDPASPAGMESVLVQGQDGQLRRTAEVTYRNGRETEREIVAEALLTPAVTEIVALGTGEALRASDTDAMPRIEDGYIYLPTGEVLTYTHTDTVRATAYTHTDAGCDMITSTGTTVHWGTVAVDPRYIPYGTRLFIVSNDGAYVYGIAVAEDCGGDIKGDRMDLYMPTYAQCMQFGRRSCTIYYLG